MSAVSLEDAKAHLNITVDTFDLELGRMLDATEAALGQRIGPLEPTEVSNRIEGFGYGLQLTTVPAVSLTSVTVVGGAALDVSTLYLDKLSGRVSRNDGWFFNNWAYDVTWVAGRDAVPPDLQLAVKELLRHLWETQRGAANRTGGVVDASIANNLPGAANTFPIRVEELLAPYEAQNSPLGA